MRAPAALLLALAACSVPLSGGPCQSDLNCPSGQGCDPASGTCVLCNPNEFVVNQAHQTGGDPAYASRCWFGTLTAALTAAGATGQAAVVKAAGWSSGEVVFSQAKGETFPLNVPANVSLSTADVPPVPAHYVIEVDAALDPAPAVQLRDGSGLSGFTVRRGSGTARDAVLVACTSSGGGSVNVASVALDGKKSGITYGLRFTTSCNVNVRGATVTNMSGPGIRIESTGAARVAVSGSTLAGNGDGGAHVVAELGTSIAMQGNDITQNAATTVLGGRKGGGVLFFGAKPAALTFTGNRVYGNLGDQVMVYSGIDGWDLTGGSSSAACSAAPPTANSFACYDTAGGGVGVSSTSTGTVDARFNRWTTNPPTVGIDYVGNVTGLLSGDSCPAVSCPP